MAFATGSGVSPRRLPVLQAPRLLVHGAYHSGRLLTYSLLGMLAGSVGSALNLAGSLAGVSEVAALAAGLVIVAWAVGTLLPARFHFRGNQERRSAFSRLLGKVTAMPPTTRSVLLGMSTGLLPCGWLYAFVVAAAGTGSAWQGFFVMVAFWMGTVPVLLGLGGLAQHLSARMRSAVPLLSAIVLLLVGLGNLWVRFDPTTNKLEAAAAAPIDATTAGELPAKPKPSCH